MDEDTEDLTEKLNAEVDEILEPFTGPSIEDLSRLKPGKFRDLVSENDPATGKRRHTKWKPEGERLFRELYMQGKSPLELSKLFGICRASAYGKIQVMGLAEERARLEQAVNTKLAQVAEDLANSSEEKLAKIDHTAFVNKCTLWAEKAMSKAGRYIENSPDAKGLLSAVNALKNAAELYRKTHRMDSGPASQGATFNFFQTSTVLNDPLARAKKVVPV